HSSRQTRPTHSFPTRRSSDLKWCLAQRPANAQLNACPACGLSDSGFHRAAIAKGHVPACCGPSKRCSFEPPHEFSHVDDDPGMRSEEHTSELQSRGHLVCRLL